MSSPDVTGLWRITPGMAEAGDRWYLASMRSRWSCLTLSLLAACGGARAGVAPGTAAPAAGPLYQGSGTVLESEAHGPQLCLGAVLTSLPPQCSGVPLVGWDWDRVDDEQRAQKTTWGAYHLVGTFDGKTFTPTEPPGPPQWSSSAPPITTPCAEPAGGWVRPDPKRATAEHLDQANIAAQAQPDFSGLWIHDPSKPAGERQDMSQVILNVAFTGDIERHTAELQKHWGGALCVVKHTHTEAELLKIQESMQQTLRELGLEMLSSSTDVVTGVVRVDVVSADASHQAKLDERHGAGVVVLTPSLRPVP